MVICNSLMKSMVRFPESASNQQLIRADIGEVWANILHNVYAALVSDLGFSATAQTDPTGTEGNVVFLHLFLDALQLQPCNPDCTSSLVFS